ncbi:MAG: vitamin B12-dependent ribonucleotide reductase [Archaeoglobaceae archaeon]
MKLTKTAKTVLKKRYLSRDEDGNVAETTEELLWRVASAIARAEENYGGNVDAVASQFYDMMAHQFFMPNSPTLMNAGTELNQLSACFVIPVEDSINGIFKAVWDMAKVQKSGGGTGFSFSRLRPKGDIVKTTKGVASGPISFIKIFDASTEQIKQGGKRRGANMGVLNVHHPDIEEFINAKREEGILRNFNLSVAVTDAFMKALRNNEDYDLVNPKTKEVVKKESARRIFDLMIDGAWRNGEPGTVFIDTINEHNPTPNVGKIESTNPCGEQPLLPYESCNLGSINVANFVRNGSIDWERLKDVVWTAVRFLDNVIDMNGYPIREIEDNTLANRKIGLGVMGFADLLFKLKIPYDSEEGIEFAEELMSFIQDESHKASTALAEERGEFPNWKGSLWEEKGMKLRNATTTTTAPTGTISIIANCSSGIEPAYALAFRRRNILDGEEFFEVNSVLEDCLKEEGIYTDELISKIAEAGTIQDIEEIPEELKRIFKCSLDISPEWHVKMQATFQKYTDNAVSKTINLPHNATRKDVEDAFLLAYDLDCKGVTVYRDGSREEQVLSTRRSEAEVKERKVLRPVTSLEPRPRPKITSGRTIETKTGCGSLYVTINEDEHGIAEVFVQLGKSGGCAASQTEAIGRLLSVALRSYLKPEALIRQLKGIRCPSIGFDKGEIVTSCADGVAKVLEKHLKGEYTKMSLDIRGIKPLNEFMDKNGSSEGESGIGVEEEPKTKLIGGMCPECGNVLEYGEGCMTCKMCGFTRCG